MNHYTKNQHYIPQFILRNFTSKKGKLGACNITKLPFQCINTTPESICFEKNINEIVNLDGTYYNKNSVELFLSKIEGEIANQFHKMSDRINTVDGILPEDRIAIASFIALQITRNPFANKVRVKKLFEPLNISEQEKQIYTNSLPIPLFLSREDLRQYLLHNYYTISDIALKGIPNVSVYVDALNHLLSGFVEYVMMPMDEGAFYFSDNVPLIGFYQECRHLIPISPHLAVCTCLPQVANSNHKKGIVRMSKEKIDSINSYIIRNARRFVMYYPDNTEQAKQDILRHRLNTIIYPL